MIIPLLIMLAPAVDTPFQAASADWARCTKAAVDRLAGSKEPAGTIADAALGECGSEERAVRHAWVARFGGARADVKMQSLRTGHRNALVAAVLKARH